MSDLDTLSRLADIRLRIANRERITPLEMRAILLDIARDRESASKLGARNRAAAKKAAGTVSPTPLDINTLFSATNERSPPLTQAEIDKVLEERNDYDY